MKCELIKLHNINVCEPKYGDLKLNVFPIDSSKELELPLEFKRWEDNVKEILEYIPFQDDANIHYITIDSKFFTQDETLRREGLHIDGNFCVDPEFKFKSWAGSYLEDGKVIQLFSSPYDFQIPLGNYISEHLGGIFCVASSTGCEAWTGYLADNVGNEGAYDVNSLKDKKSTILLPNNLYFMSSNTPHRSLITTKGHRRTLIRITLNHNYNNRVILRHYKNKLIA